MLGSTVVLLFPKATCASTRPGSRAGRCASARRWPSSGAESSRRARRLRRRQPALRALAEAIGPRVLPQLELAFGDADIEPDALPAALAGAPIAVIDHTALPIEVAARCDGLRDVVFLGTGARSYMDPEALAAIGIAVHLIKGYGDTAVAECAIGLLFDAARKFAAMDRAMRDGRWLRSEGTQLAGKTLGLIGYRRHRRRGRAHGDRDRHEGARLEPHAEGRRAGRRVRRRSSACSPRATRSRSTSCSTDETRGFLSAARIAAMRRGALLVNTARGALVDEAAMVDALRSGQIGHAGLDVFDGRAAAAGPCADDARQRHAVGALRLSHAGGEHAPDRGGVRALRADRRAVLRRSAGRRQAPGRRGAMPEPPRVPALRKEARAP